MKKILIIGFGGYGVGQYVKDHPGLLLGWHNQTATALPFANDSCFIDGIFNCTGFAYEYCQYNSTSNCYMLNLYGYQGHTGHEINILKLSNTSVSGMNTYAVIEPQWRTDAVPLATWTQAAGGQITLPPDVRTKILKEYSADLGMTSANTIDDLKYVVLFSTITPDQYYYVTGNNIWYSTWFPVNDLRNLTDKFYYSGYRPKESIPLCSKLQNKSCSANALYRISSVNKDLEYGAYACLDKKMYPTAVECNANNQMVQVTRGKAVAPVNVQVSLNTSTTCPTGTPGSTVTYSVDSPQLNGFVGNISASIYVDGIQAVNLPSTKLPATFTLLPANYVGNKSAGYITHKIYAILYISSPIKDSPTLPYVSNTVSMNVGIGGCKVGTYTSHDTYAFYCSQPQGKNPSAQVEIDMPSVIGGWNDVTYNPGGASTNCSIQGLSITNPQLLSPYAIQFGSKVAGVIKPLPTLYSKAGTYPVVPPYPQLYRIVASGGTGGTGTGGKNGGKAKFMSADINQDDKVDNTDYQIIAAGYGSKIGDQNYNPDCRSKRRRHDQYRRLLCSFKLTSMRTMQVFNALGSGSG
jgi:hypothetical protein